MFRILPFTLFLLLGTISCKKDAMNEELNENNEEVSFQNAISQISPTDINFSHDCLDLTGNDAMQFHAGCGAFFHNAIYEIQGSKILIKGSGDNDGNSHCAFSITNQEMNGSASLVGSGHYHWENISGQQNSFQILTLNMQVCHFPMNSDDYLLGYFDGNMQTTTNGLQETNSFEGWVEAKSN